MQQLRTALDREKSCLVMSQCLLQKVGKEFNGQQFSERFNQGNLMSQKRMKSHRKILAMEMQC